MEHLQDKTKQEGDLSNRFHVSPCSKAHAVFLKRRTAVLCLSVYVCVCMSVCVWLAVYVCVILSYIIRHMRPHFQSHAQVLLTINTCVQWQPIPWPLTPPAQGCM